MIFVLEQVGILMLFAAVGFILGKFRFIKVEQSELISVILVKFFLPCMIFESLSTGCTIKYITSNYVFILTSAAFVTAFYLIAHFFVTRLFTKDNYERKVYDYTFVASNFGYMGCPLAEGIYGSTGLLNMIVFGLPLNLYAYSLGYASLSNQKTSLKSFVNPVLISFALGVFFGLTAIPIPSFLSTVIDSAASCVGPLAMLLTGITISEFDFKELLTDKKAYIISALRLIVIPLVVLLILKPFAPESLVQTATMCFAMPCGLNTVIVAKAFGENYRLGAKFAVVSNVLSLITLPLIISLI